VTLSKKWNKEDVIGPDMHGQYCSEENCKYRSRPRTPIKFHVLIMLYTNMHTVSTKHRIVTYAHM